MGLLPRHFECRALAVLPTHPGQDCAKQLKEKLLCLIKQILLVDPRGIEPRTHPCHGYVLPLYHGPFGNNYSCLRFSIFCPLFCLFIPTHYNPNPLQFPPQLTIRCPHPDSNRDPLLRRELFYPIELWGPVRPTEVIVFYIKVKNGLNQLQNKNLRQCR